jgi:hypothetical protein
MSTTKTQAPTTDLTKSTRDKHKEFIFPAMIQYYAEPIVFTEGRASASGTRTATSTSTSSAAS